LLEVMDLFGLGIQPGWIRPAAPLPLAQRERRVTCTTNKEEYDET
jgi:hypothetical protein